MCHRFWLGSREILFIHVDKGNHLRVSSSRKFSFFFSAVPFYTPQSSSIKSKQPNQQKINYYATFLLLVQSWQICLNSRTWTSSFALSLSFIEVKTTKPLESDPVRRITFNIFVAFNTNNYWCLSQFMREPMAEFAGVAVFLVIGTGVDCQVTLSTNSAIASSPKGVSRVSREKVACIKSVLIFF